jgi:transposase-like protein
MKQILRSDSVCNGSIVYSLHRGRSHRTLVRVIPDCCGLYRVAWPDIGLSDLANLTRCKAAAREWAERNTVLEDRKTNVARRLKSLDNFWWARSYVAQNIRGAA